MLASSPLAIEVVSSNQTAEVLPELITLLQDSVASGASVGFLPPLSVAEAQTYWQEVLSNIASQKHILLIARLEQTIVGSVQLDLATRANARHRAEVQKLFVLQSQRRLGIGRQLMQAVEQVAIEKGLTLLVLDTRQGDNAERLYRKLGYSEAGVIPTYARNATGELDATVYFYKLLPEASIH